MHQSIAVQSCPHPAPPGRPPRRTVIFMCNCFVVSVWEYMCNSNSLHFLASEETRSPASIAEFGSSQRGPAASRECPTQSVCRVGVFQLLQVRDAMETSCLDDSQGSSIWHWNIQAAAHGCHFLLPGVLHAYLKHTPAQTSTLVIADIQYI